jgi:hypothetical protein
MVVGNVLEPCPGNVVDLHALVWSYTRCNLPGKNLVCADSIVSELLVSGDHKEWKLGVTWEWIRARRILGEAGRKGLYIS